jgi:predicted nuclease of predicted toxin-antitoxin system
MIWPKYRTARFWSLQRLKAFVLWRKDADFAKRSRLYGSPPKVIWLRCGNAPTSSVEAIFRSGAETIQEFISNTSLDCLELYWLLRLPHK